MQYPSRVTIVEVGPRDGFQVERTFIPTELKVEVVDAIARAGVRKIETSSFVSPKFVPQLADAAELFGAIERQPGTRYTALVPNLKGVDRAIEAAVHGLTPIGSHLRLNGLFSLVAVAVFAVGGADA